MRTQRLTLKGFNRIRPCDTVIENEVMVDWFYIGYCTVLAMFAVAAAYAAVVGLRALRRLPRSLLVGFAAAAIVATLTAQKTNNVPPNMNQPQMMQGGGSFQTGFTSCPNNY